MGAMAKVRCLVLGGLAMLAQVRGVPAADDLLDKEIAALIRELGADSYKARQRATARLWRIGRPAVAALEAAARSEDLEVSTRAGMILADLRAGIEPDWPLEIVALARKVNWCVESQRRAGLEAICKALKGKALPFLLARLTAGGAKDKAHALGCIEKLASSDRAIYGRIIELLDQPANEYQGQALILARVHTGSTIAALKLMSKYDPGSSERRKIVVAAVENITGLLKQYRFESAAKEAAEFAEAVPADPRFVYLQAEAVSALGDDARAATLRARALALNPDAEVPHYTAGEMLQQKLGRRTLAEKEWERVLGIAPADGVYDMNALIRLHSIYKECGLFERAAERLSEALDLVEAARRKSGGVGIVGGSIASLRERAEGLRVRARGRPPGGNAKVRDKWPDNQMRLNIQVAVRDGKLTELREALGKVSATVGMNVQPRGLRLFDKKLLTVRYDAGKQEVGVYLNNSRCCAPAPLHLSGKTGRFAIRSLDCYHIFEVDPAGGQARRIARFEKDYMVYLRPGDKIAAWREVALKINGKPRKWKDLLAGVAFDYLPEKLAVTIEGKRPTGEPLELKFNITPEDPPIRPLPPASSGATEQRDASRPAGRAVE